MSQPKPVYCDQLSLPSEIDLNAKVQEFMRVIELGVAYLDSDAQIFMVLIQKLPRLGILPFMTNGEPEKYNIQIRANENLANLGGKDVSLFLIRKEEVGFLEATVKIVKRTHGYWTDKGFLDEALVDTFPSALELYLEDKHWQYSEQLSKLE